MPLEMRWVGQEDLDRVARTRMLCFAHAATDLPRHADWIRTDTRAVPGDFLLAERDRSPVGTATSLSMTMWIAGAAVPFQGVAFVGTVRTERRRGDREAGVATQVMRETLRRAREREQAVSGLMPFRASFYEHFGYGLVERQNQWTVPLTILPNGSCESIRLFEADDLPELVRFHQRVVERGTCDIERPEAAWRPIIKDSESGFLAVDRPEPSGPVRGCIQFEHEKNNGRDVLRIVRIEFEDIPALLRALRFLGSLRDQYSAAVMKLPVDLPLNLLLRETQLPHRPVNHPAAELRQITRMQLRVLDHRLLIEPMRLRPDRRGRVIVAVHECEGEIRRFALDIAEGRATITPTRASAQFECPDRIWAPIVCGDLPAERAVALGLASCTEPGAIQAMQAFDSGKLPFCHEYF